MIVRSLEVGSFLSNAFVVADEVSGRACVIDPGAEAERIVAEVEGLGAEAVCVLLTHGHVDHAAAARTVGKRLKIPVLMHPADRRWLAASGFISLFFGQKPRRLRSDGELADGQNIEVGRLALEVRHAPGHTKGSVVFLAPGALFAGDLLFEGSVGRTDLPGGSYRDLIASLARVILPLPDETIVYPGHGPATTVGRERLTNPFLREARRLAS